MRYLLPAGITNSHPFYKSWAHMKERCDNPSAWAYQYYGAKGITYSPRYAFFQNFYDDFWTEWRYGLTIDRVDGSAGYFKENIRWVTKKENAQSRGWNKLTQEIADEIRAVFALGELRQGELAKRYGVTQAQISNIVRGRQWVRN